MRAKPCQSESVGIRLAVDQQQVPVAALRGLHAGGIDVAGAVLRVGNGRTLHRIGFDVSPRPFETVKGG